MSHKNFLLVISLVKVNTSLCRVTQGGGGGGRRDVTKCHTGRGGSKKCGKSSSEFGSEKGLTPGQNRPIGESETK